MGETTGFIGNPDDPELQVLLKNRVTAQAALHDKVPYPTPFVWVQHEVDLRRCPLIHPDLRAVVKLNRPAIKRAVRITIWVQWDS